MASVARQTYPVVEHIVVDNCSTDATWEQINSVAHDAAIIAVRPREPLSIPDAYALALSRASAEWIAILDGDDVWLPRRCEAAQRSGMLDDPDVALHFCDVDMVDAELRKLEPYRWQFQPRRRAGPLPRLLEAPLEPLLRLELIPPSVGVMVRRSALESVGGFVRFPGLPLVDLPTWIALARRFRFGYTPEVVGLYRRHAGAVMRNHSIAALTAQVKQVEDVLRTDPRPTSRLAAASIIASNRGYLAYAVGLQQRRDGDHLAAMKSFLRASAGASRRGTSSKALVRLGQTVLSGLATPQQGTDRSAPDHQARRRTSQRLSNTTTATPARATGRRPGPPSDGAS